MSWLYNYAGRLLVCCAIIAGALLGAMVLEGDTADPTWAQLPTDLKVTIILWWVFVILFIISFVLFFYKLGRSAGGHSNKDS